MTDTGGFSAPCDVEAHEAWLWMYGAVAAFGDGVHIMGITDPAHQAPASAAFDGAGDAHSSGRGG